MDGFLVTYQFDVRVRLACYELHVDIARLFLYMRELVDAESIAKLHSLN